MDRLTFTGSGLHLCPPTPSRRFHTPCIAPSIGRPSNAVPCARICQILHYFLQTLRTCFERNATLDSFMRFGTKSPRQSIYIYIVCSFCSACPRSSVPHPSSLSDSRFWLRREGLPQLWTNTFAIVNDDTEKFNDFCVLLSFSFGQDRPGKSQWTMAVSLSKERKNWERRGEQKKEALTSRLFYSCDWNERFR